MLRKLITTFAIVLLAGAYFPAGSQAYQLVGTTSTTNVTQALFNLKASGTNPYTFQYTP